jgi:hypothetical protein
VSLLHGNLINGNVRNILQARFRKIPFEPLFFNLPDGIPRDSEMLGNILTSHRIEEVKNISCKESGIAFFLFGKGRQEEV